MFTAKSFTMLSSFCGFASAKLFSAQVTHQRQVIRDSRTLRFFLLFVASCFTLLDAIKQDAYNASLINYALPRELQNTKRISTLLVMNDVSVTIVQMFVIGLFEQRVTPFVWGGLNFFTSIVAWLMFASPNLVRGELIGLFFVRACNVRYATMIHWFGPYYFKHTVATQFFIALLPYLLKLPLFHLYREIVFSHQIDMTIAAATLYGIFCLWYFLLSRKTESRLCLEENRFDDRPRQNCRLDTETCYCDYCATELTLISQAKAQHALDQHAMWQHAQDRHAIHQRAEDRRAMAQYAEDQQVKAQHGQEPYTQDPRLPAPSKLQPPLASPPSPLPPSPPSVRSALSTLNKPSLWQLSSAADVERAEASKVALRSLSSDDVETSRKISIDRRDQRTAKRPCVSEPVFMSRTKTPPAADAERSRRKAGSWLANAACTLFLAGVYYDFRMFDTFANQVLHIDFTYEMIYVHFGLYCTVFLVNVAYNATKNLFRLRLSRRLDHESTEYCLRMHVLRYGFAMFSFAGVLLGRIAFLAMQLELTEPSFPRLVSCLCLGGLGGNVQPLLAEMMFRQRAALTTLANKPSSTPPNSLLRKPIVRNQIVALPSAAFAPTPLTTSLPSTKLAPFAKVQNSDKCDATVDIAVSFALAGEPKSHERGLLTRFWKAHSDQIFKWIYIDGRNLVNLMMLGVWLLIWSMIDTWWFTSTTIVLVFTSMLLFNLYFFRMIANAVK